jgi:hypothetical protein
LASILQQTVAGAVRVPVFLLVSVALGAADLLGDLPCLQEDAMTAELDQAAFAVFIFFFGLVAMAGFIAGWAAGFSSGIWLAWTNDFKPLHTLHFGGTSVTL